MICPKFEILERSAPPEIFLLPLPIHLSSLAPSMGCSLSAVSSLLSFRCFFCSFATWLLDPLLLGGHKNMPNKVKITQAPLMTVIGGGVESRLI